LLTVSPLLRMERSPAGGWLVRAGQGSQREAVQVEGTALASWILGLDGPRSRADLEASLAEVVQSAASARELLLLMIDCGVLIEADAASRLRTKGEHWERHGWRDAFDFHYAGVGLTFYWPPDVGEYRQSVEGFFQDSERHGMARQPAPYRERDGPPAIALHEHLANYPQSTAISMTELLSRDRPILRFDGTALPIADLARVLKHAFGVQRSGRTEWGEVLFKTYPSGGARHPLELYVVARRVSDVEPGTYHYDLQDDALRIVSRPDAQEIEGLTFPHVAVGTAPALLVVTCRWLRSFWKYRYSRNYRMILLELGHMAETVRLVASAFGVDSYCAPVVDEHRAVELLRLGNDLVEGAAFVIGLGSGVGH
jgi:SagB-type dehydrogenase family enzyme